MRTLARETLFKIVFAHQFIDQESGLMTALYKADKLNEGDIQYCERVLKLLYEHSEELECILDKHSKLFPASGLFPADRSVLFIALSEIMYLDDIPTVVSINEAVNIVAKYSSPKSADFVNGILSEIVREEKNV